MSNEPWISKIMTFDADSRRFTTKCDDGLLLQLHIQPNSSMNEIVGIYNERLKIKIACQPVDGKANAVLCDFLAEQFKVPKRSVMVIKGLSSRQKTVKINKDLPWT